MRGCILVAIVMLLCGWVMFFNIYPFLAITDRIPANTLVVEGWVHEYAINAGVEEFQRGSYNHLFTTGGPVTGKGGYINDYNTSASVGAELLKKAGIASDAIQVVPSRVTGRDRTYSSAVALKGWLREHNMQVLSINILTEGTHARRTRLLFAKALGPNVDVGIIAAPNPDYDPKYWWRYSEGVEDVLGESVGYLYAKFFFHPRSAARDVAQQ